MIEWGKEKSVGAYRHGERKLLCGSAEIVVLRFESFALTVKNLPLNTPLCKEKKACYTTKIQASPQM